MCGMRVALLQQPRRCLYILECDVSETVQIISGVVAQLIECIFLTLEKPVADGRLCASPFGERNNYGSILHLASLQVREEI